MKFEDIAWQDQSSTELDTSYKKTIFDVRYDIWSSVFYFRCTSIAKDNDLKSSISFLHNDSDVCDDKTVDYIKQQIRELYF